MASTLRNAAANSVNKGQPSTYYVGEKPNPVFQALDQEIKLYVGFMKKRTNPGYRPSTEEASSRASDALFELWKKYEHRLPKSDFQRKLLEMGDFLASIKEYDLALWQCYGRYLNSFGDLNVEEVTEVQHFQSVFFPDGFDGEDAGFTFRALMGKIICTYQVIKMTDPKLQNVESVDKSLQLLAFLRLNMQVVLPKERLCWLVYNGTIHMYSICRHLMSLGHSAKVLEYLLWACMCMEASVPLLAVKYLPWRSTLYTAVCQCYYDCKAGQHAEAFARRALSKVNELCQLENMSNTKESVVSEAAFRQATFRMATMIYKRTVFETRRKPKGLLRPKTRANLKDAAALPWPRTQSEKLLVDMFEGSAAQSLCILETLSDSNRRTLISAPPSNETDVEILDVYAEIFMAAHELIAGGGGTPNVARNALDLSVPGLGGVIRQTSMIDLATSGENGVSMGTVVKLVKYAYCYEQWDTLDQLLPMTITALKELDDRTYAADEKALEILQAYDRVVPRSKQRKLFTNQDEDEEGFISEPPPTLPPPPQSGQKSPGSQQDDLLHLAEVLLAVVNGQFTPDQMDVDMIVDAALMMWTKCKSVFQKFQTGSTDNPKYLQRMDNPGRWVYIMDIVQQVLGWCGLSSVDPALTAEVVLRLALVYEASAALEQMRESKSKSARSNLTRSRDLEDETTVVSTIKDVHLSRAESAITSVSQAVSGEDATSTQSPQQSIPKTPTPAPPHTTAVMLGQSVREQLLQARDILEAGLANVSFARTVVALTDGKSIADISWVKEFNPEVFKPQSDTDKKDSDTARTDQKTETDRSQDQLGNLDETGNQSNREQSLFGGGGDDATAVWNLVKDLHMELVFMYHRVCLKLADLGSEPNTKPTTKAFKRQTCSKMQYLSSGRVHSGLVESFEELVTNCRSDRLSQSLLFMQRALALSHHGVASPQQRQLLQDAMGLIMKVEAVEKKVYTENTGVNKADDKKSKVPPAPILLSRTDTSMVFKPAAFNPSSQQKVAWYRLFARNSAGSNVRVRLNDYYLPGTGEEVPAFHCELRASGLTPGEKYVFAVAAYTADGDLIGGGVGNSTRAILASHPMPVLMTWAYLTQTAYQTHCYDIAQEACSVLWSHFVAKPPPPQQVTFTTSAQKDFKLSLHKLNRLVVAQSSPVLLRMFLSSIFISVDITIKEAQLFCDVLCDKGPLLKAQIERLRQCEKMLVSMELAGWLNESNLALQSVVQCYGLLAPMIHYKIPASPILQVLERCVAILQEIPSHLRLRRTTAINESLHHMTACLVFHMAKILRTWGQRALAATLTDAGRRLLVQDKAGLSDSDALAPLMAGDLVNESGSLTVAGLKKKKTKKSCVSSGKDDGGGVGNEELKALEAHMLRLSKQAQGEHELSGNEEPSILHAYIAYLPSRIAYKEVVKFKRRNRYLEFFVQCAQKGLAEGISDMVLEWCEDAAQWLIKRNENIIGTKAAIGKQPGAVTIMGDDPKKFQAALVEYSKDKRLTGPGHGMGVGFTDMHPVHEEREESPKGKNKSKEAAPKARPKKIKYKPIGITPAMSDTQKHAQEELEIKALDILSLYFVDAYLTRNRRRKLRKVSTEEMPWRSQLNIVAGLSQFGVFLQKMEMREKLLGGNAASYMYRTSFLEQDWFTFETAGTLVVGWQGVHSRLQTRQGNPHETGSVQEPSKSQVKAAGIELAAAVATGTAGPPLFPIPVEEDDDTPRTYRSEGSPRQPTNKLKAGGRKNKKADEDPMTMLLTREDAMTMLKRSFTFLNQAVVLAHRGRHWILLQNACRALWNCAHAALVRLNSPDKNGEAFLDTDTLRALVWKPFWTSADCLLDMLIQLQGENNRQTRKRDKRPDASDRSHGLPKSWLGGVKDEKGGASLKFEAPLDDISRVDTRWLGRMVLRVMELLYYEQKWERLVDIALRFNALSDERYAEQVNPLVVQAQRKLIQRTAQYDGKLPPQPHFQVAMEKNNTNWLTAKDYVVTQLEVQVKDEELSQINPGAHIDPEGHDAYSGGLHALRLCCVPLDVSYTLASLRSALDKTHYTARALQHSRRLLILYLAGSASASGEHTADQDSTHVDFVPNTAFPKSAMPLDLSNEEFLSADDVQTTALPRGQIGVVMSSYDKTIEMLLASNHKGLAAEAMRELGNLQYHTANVRGAYRWWAESLDLLMGTQNAVYTWRDQLKGQGDPTSYLLGKCGLWGCLLGGILSSNIAQYILTADLGLRIECCFLSGYFFKALFRSSLPHPTADRDYALYEVGEGCEVTNLVPGVDLLSERFRSDGRSLVAALRFILDELHRGRHNLFVLPLLTLYQFFTTFVCRDLQRSVNGRILKVHILTDLGLFSEAITTLLRVLHGERLPHSADSNFRQVDSRPVTTKFNSQKPILDPSNLKLLESVLEKRLSSNLGTLYGPHLTCHLSVAHAQLLVAIAETLPVLPKFEDIAPPGSSVYVKPHTISTVSRGPDKRPQFGPSSKIHGTNKASKPDDQEAWEQQDSTMRNPNPLTSDKKPATLEVVKGMLLATGDQMLSTVSEILVENAQQDQGLEFMAAAELELVIQAKLQLANIAQQRHHAAMASRIVLSALKVLQGTHLFQQKPDDSPPAHKVSSMVSKHGEAVAPSPVKLVEFGTSRYEYQNFQSRSRLDARTWLQCRYALVKSLMGEVSSMGQVKGPERSVKVELAEVSEYCMDGMAEAETCGDIEMQAEFILQSSLLNLTQGKPVQETKQMLQELLNLLSQVRQLSGRGQFVQAVTLMHLTDLEAVESGEGADRNKTSILPHTRKQYITVQNMLLMQLEDLGEMIEHRYDGQAEFSCPQAPLQNLYLPQLLPLVQVKLRLGQAMARQAAATTKHMDQMEAAAAWALPLGVLTTALETSKVIATRVASVETEILLYMGRVQRQLFHRGLYQPRAAGETLVEAVKTSFHNDHDLGLMRQAYLELAILYLSSSGLILQNNSTLESIQSEDESIASSLESQQKSQKKWKGKKPRRDERKAQLPESEKDQEKRAAWLAIRCAAAVGQAMRARSLLPGHPTITNQTITTKAIQDLPDFIVLDLVGSYVLGERKRVYKNDIEEELAPLTEALEPPPIETYEDQLNHAREAMVDLSWVHILGYQSMLQRLYSTSALSVATKSDKNNSENEDAVNIVGGLDVGFINHAQSNISQNHNVVRGIVFGVPWALRLNYLNAFLSSSLPMYASECSGVYPPALLQLKPIDSTLQLAAVDVISKSYSQNLCVPPDRAPDASCLSLTSAPGTQENLYKPGDKPLVEPKDSELCLQWYLPVLDENNISVHEEGVGGGESHMQQQVMLLYAIGRKPDVKHSAMIWVSLAQLMDLHDRLMVLMQRAEISLIDKEKKKEPTTVTASKGRKQARIKALSPKMKRDEQLEALLRQCMASAQMLFGFTPESEITESIMQTATEGEEVKVPQPKSASTRKTLGESTEEQALQQPQQSEIPFDVTKSNIRYFEHLFDPSLGFTLNEAKMLAWFLQFFSPL